MKIVVYDTFCTGVVHKKFNAALLETLADSFYEIEYFSLASYGKGLAELMDSESAGRIRFRSLFVWNGEKRWDVLLRYLIGVFQNIRMLILSDSNQILLYNFDNPFSLWFMNVLNKFLKRNVIIVCHGEMEHLIPGVGNGGLLYKLIGFCIRGFFINRHRQPTVTFMVLGGSVLYHIQKILPKNMAERFKQIELPYIYEQEDCIEEKTDSSLCLGTVGTFNKYRGGTGLVQLIEKLKGEQRVRFSVTGKIDWGLEKLKSLNVSIPENEGRKMVGAAEFKQRISELDYILYFYPSNSYKLIASAAVMDAIDLRKPIIAIRNDYFEHLFKHYGAFGYLVDDIQEMAQLIVKIVEDGNVEEFKFDKIRQDSSPQAISIQLVDIIKSVINQ